MAAVLVVEDDDKVARPARENQSLLSLADA